MTTEEQWLTTEELCAHYKLRRDWVYDHVRRSDIPYYKVGRHLRFKRSEWDDYMAGKRVIPAEVSPT